MGGNALLLLAQVVLVSPRTSTSISPFRRFHSFDPLSLLPLSDIHPKLYTIN